MKRIVGQAVIAVLAVFVLGGCGGGGGDISPPPPPPPPPFNLTGHWVGGFGQRDMEMNLAQSEAQFSGVFESVSGPVMFGRFGGTVSGQDLTLTIAVIEPCRGMFTGTGTVEDDSGLADLRFTYSGDNCGSAVSGSGHFIRVAN